MDTTKIEDDQIFGFFDDMYNSIPKQYKKVDVEIDQVEEEDKPGVSLFEIGDRATKKIKEEQKANAKKSVDKIAEITKKRGETKKDEPDASEDEDVEMGSLDFVDSEGGDEEKEGKKGKGKKEDGVDKKKKKVYENKNTVGTDKL